MVLRSDCRFCQQSMPFYPRLLERNTRDLEKLRSGDEGFCVFGSHEWPLEL